MPRSSPLLECTPLTNGYPFFVLCHTPSECIHQDLAVFVLESSSSSTSSSFTNTETTLYCDYTWSESFPEFGDGYISLKTCSSFIKIAAHHVWWGSGMHVLLPRVFRIRTNSSATNVEKMGYHKLSHGPALLGGGSGVRRKSYSRQYQDDMP